MSAPKITKDEYLDKNFDFTKLTKQELRQIMSENNVEEIPALTSLKSVIIDAYRKNIYDRIDELKGKFSKENIFQKDKANTRKRQSIDASDFNGQKNCKNEQDVANESMMSRRNSIRSQTCNTDNKLGDQSFVNSTFLSEVNHSRISQRHHQNESSDIENSEINSTSFSLNSNRKDVFVSLPKKHAMEAEIEKNEKTPKANAKSPISPSKTLMLILKTALLLIAVFLLYLRFLCPYCKPGSSFCIPVPLHSKLDGNKIVCDTGYRLVGGLFNYCVPIVRSETEINQKLNKLIRSLEYLKGEYKYGYTKLYKLKLSSITDETVRSLLLNSPLIISQNGLLESKNYRVSMKIFIKYYTVLILKSLLVMTCVSVIAFFYNKRRTRIKDLKNQANLTTKEVLDTLNRQIMMAVKSSSFKPYVLSQQIKDVFEIKDDVWSYVEDNIRKNSNVEKGIDAQGNVVWKWVGPVLYKNNESVEF